MKLLILSIIVFLCACKKQNDLIIYTPGTQFNYTTSNNISGLKQQHNGTWVIPANPFTIDSICPQSVYPDDMFYYCHSINGNQYQMPESDMKIIK